MVAYVEPNLPPSFACLRTKAIAKSIYSPYAEESMFNQLRSARLVVSTTRLLPLELVIEDSAPSTEPVNLSCIPATLEAIAAASLVFPTLNNAPAQRLSKYGSSVFFEISITCLNSSFKFSKSYPLRDDNTQTM